ncbi:TIGR04104 family putative zinc finger protein [Virgibacillus alimentarius]|uniref:TIGR04104 family putative zinc finger protein n=1 Tax=Virgibacillus alimentarius TaxID=698769 RepID=UPI001D058889
MRGFSTLQKCESCNSQFSWSKIYKSFWWSYKPIKCDSCGAKNNITISGRLTFVSLTILPMLIFGQFFSPFSNSLLTLGISLIIFLVGSLLVPFFVTYKASL